AGRLRGGWRLGAHAAALWLVAGVVLLALRGPPAANGVEVDAGARLWVLQGRSVLAIGGRVSPRVLEGLRERHVHRLDVLVVTRPGTAAADGAWPIVQAFRPRVVLAPEHHQLAGARTARRGAMVQVGGLRVDVTDGGPPLAVTVRSAVYRHPGDPPSG
nr:hypothetical protein [Actinomycetota bacterium]